MVLSVCGVCSKTSPLTQIIRSVPIPTLVATDFEDIDTGFLFRRITVVCRQ